MGRRQQENPDTWAEREWETGKEGEGGRNRKADKSSFSLQVVGHVPHNTSALGSQNSPWRKQVVTSPFNR